MIAKYWNKRVSMKLCRGRHDPVSTYSFPQAGPAPASRAPLRLLYIAQDQYSKGGWNSKLHTHGCAELFFITDGHGRFRTQTEEFPVSMRDLILINNNVSHTELSRPDSPLEYIVLGVDGLEAMTGAPGYTMLHLHSGWEELMGFLELMVREAREAQPGYEQACAALLSVVLVRLRRLDGVALSDEPSAPRTSRECGLVRRYIDNHFKEDLSLDQLAELAHLNKYYLAHTFRREFGVSPINYLISRRIEESRFLLRETDHSLSLIAQMLGFSSLSYFSQSFRRVQGVSPMEYRKQNR